MGIAPPVPLETDRAEERRRLAAAVLEGLAAVEGPEADVLPATERAPRGRLVVSGGQGRRRLLGGSRQRTGEGQDGRKSGPSTDARDGPEHFCTLSLGPVPLLSPPEIVSGDRTPEIVVNSLR